MSHNNSSELARMLTKSGTNGNMKFYRFDTDGSARLIDPNELNDEESIERILAKHRKGELDIIASAADTPSPTVQAFNNGDLSTLPALDADMLDKRMNSIGRIVGEVTEFSEHLNFLSMLSSKVYSTKQLIPLLRTVMFEMAARINATTSFISIHNNDIVEMIETNSMEVDEAMHLLRNVNFKEASDHQAAVLATLEDGRSMVVAPLLTQSGPRGFMAFLRRPDEEAFTVSEQQVVGIINCSMSSTVEAIFLYDFLRETYMNTVRALATAIEAKDTYTHGHSHRVAKYSTYIGKKLGMADEELHNLEIAAYMHDIGKIGIKESVLCKPGRLTDDEFEQIKMHPIYTEKILEPINLPRFIIDAAVHHHERMQGQGYPYGRSGNDLSAPARIIAVADVFDAVTSDRTYRSAMTVEQAFGIIVRGIDTEFDPAVVNALTGHFIDPDAAAIILQAHPHLEVQDEPELPGALRHLYAEHGHRI